MTTKDYYMILFILLLACCKTLKFKFGSGQGADSHEPSPQLSKASNQDTEGLPGYELYCNWDIKPSQIKNDATIKCGTRNDQKKW